MKVRRKHYPEAEVIIYSIIDIAFLLLIFFILTTTLARTAGTKLSIPSGVSDPARKDEKQLSVNLRPGEIFYGEKAERLSLVELRDRLRRENLLARDPNRRIVIVESTTTVPYEEYFQVVTAIAKAGGVIALVDYEDEGGKQP